MTESTEAIFFLTTPHFKTKLAMGVQIGPTKMGLSSVPDIRHQL